MSQTELIHHHKCGERSEKVCTDCRTAKTPMWRLGPHGPKSLCNACGIKFRKKKGGGRGLGLGGDDVVGLNKESSSKKKEKSSPVSSTTAAIATDTTDCSGKKGNNDGNANRGQNGKLGSKMKKVRLMGLGKEVVFLKRPRSPMKRQRSFKKLGEVEQAARLLMALSCDFYA